MSDLIDSIVERINYYRSNPSYAKINKNTPKVSSFTKRPSKAVRLINELTAAAEEYLSYGKTKYALDEDILKLHLNHYIEDFYSCAMIIGEGKEVEDIINSMFSKSNGIELLNREYNYIGVVNNGITVVILCDSSNKPKNKNFNDKLFQEINHLRQYPKSYIKYVKKFLNDKKRITTNLISFLLTLRSFKPLQSNNVLTKACIEYGELSNYSDKELREHISCYGSAFKHVDQIKRNGYDNPVELIVNHLSENEDFISNILFSKLYDNIGINHDDDSKRTVILFSDNINDKKSFENSKTVNKKVKRPELTYDEIKQIKSDFCKLDVMNKGTIKPNIILAFINNNDSIYVRALKMLDNTENNNKGISCDVFIDTITNILATLKDYREFFDILCGNKRNISSDSLNEIAKELNYQTSEGEIKDLVENVAEVSTYIKANEFYNMMRVVCNLK